MVKGHEVTAHQIEAHFKEHIRVVAGSPDTKATSPCSQTDLKPQGLVFIGDKKYLKTALESAASLIVIDEKWVNELPTDLNNKTVLASKNTYLAMALVNTKFFSLPFLRAPFEKENIHKSAQIHPSVELGSNVVVGPGAVLLQGVKVGARTFIGANTVVEAHTTIGEDSFIHPQVYIGHSTEIGNRVEIKPHSTVGSDGFGYAHDEKNNHYRIPHYGKLIIEDDVHIGANVNIDRGTFDSAIIGRGTKIDNHCHFAHNTKLGENSLITAGFIVAGSTTIGKNAVTAGRVSVNGHTNICDNVQLGALAAVTSDIKKPGAYLGYPVAPFKEALKAQMSIAKLPQIRKNITRIMSHLGLKETDNKE